MITVNLTKVKSGTDNITNGADGTIHFFFFLVVFKKTVFPTNYFRQLSSEELLANDELHKKVVYIGNILYNLRHLSKISSDES